MIFSKLSVLAVGAIAPLFAFASPSTKGLCEVRSSRGCGGNEVCRTPTDERQLRMIPLPLRRTFGNCVDRKRSVQDVDLLTRDSEKGCNIADNEGCDEGEVCVFTPFRPLDGVGSSDQAVFVCVEGSKDEQDDVKAGDVCNPKYENACGNEMTCTPDEEGTDGVVGVCTTKGDGSEEKEKRKISGGKDLKGLVGKGQGLLGLRSVDGSNKTNSTDEEKRQIGGILGKHNKGVKGAAAVLARDGMDEKPFPDEPAQEGGDKIEGYPSFEDGFDGTATETPSSDPELPEGKPSDSEPLERRYGPDSGEIRGTPEDLNE